MNHQSSLTFMGIIIFLSVLPYLENLTFFGRDGSAPRGPFPAGDKEGSGRPLMSILNSDDLQIIGGS